MAATFTALCAGVALRACNGDAVSAGATLIVRNIGALVTCDPRAARHPGWCATRVLIAAGGRLTYAGDRGRGAAFRRSRRTSSTSTRTAPR